MPIRPLTALRTAYKPLFLLSLAALWPVLASASTVQQGARPRVSVPYLLAGGPGNQGEPQMAGNVMVYTNCTAGDCNVYTLDLATRQATPIAQGDWDEQQPNTDGLRIVWRDGRNVDGRNGENRLNNFDVHGAYLADRAPFVVAKAPRMQNRPSVWGNTVVYADFRAARGESDQEAGDIYMTDIPSGRETLISGARSAQVRPVTNGKVVVWADYRNEPNPNGTNSDIYGYDLASKQEFVISNAPDTQTDPAISGDTVVWADFRRGDGNADIYGYDLTTHKEFPISTAPGSQIEPGISGNIVVWADFRNEKNPAGTNSDIYGYDLASKQEFPIYVGAGRQAVPRVAGSSVAWEDLSKGPSDRDIYGATISGINIAPAAPAPPVLPGKGSNTFAETGKTVFGLFLDYWTRNGALPQQGFPISDVMREVSDLDGKPYTVQYFERAVFEYHPEEKPPYNVLLSQLGTFQYRRKYPNGAPNQTPNNEPGSVLVPETGKRLGGAFLDYWRAHGGLAQQGFPISEEFTEVSDLDGKPYAVQYFERAVFEKHPENPPPYDILLSQLGTFRYRDKYGGR